MDTILDFLLVFFILGGMAFIVALMGREREIGFWTLFAVSVFFTPFVGVIFGLLSKKKNASGIPNSNTGGSFWQRFIPKRDK